MDIWTEARCHKKRVKGRKKAYEIHALCASPLNQLTNFHEIWSERYTIGGHPSLSYNMTDAQTCETQWSVIINAPLELRIWNVWRYIINILQIVCCSCLGSDALWSGRWLPMFQSDILPPSSVWRPHFTPLPLWEPQISFLHIMLEILLS
jgi:hypothetical protein